MDLNYLARILFLTRYRSRRAAKRDLRDFGGKGTAEELDAVLQEIASHPQREWIEQLADELGAAWRAEETAAVAGNLVADQTAERGEKPNAIALWRFSPAEHSAWIEAGLGDLPYDDYTSRIDATAEHLRSLGHRIVFVTATVAEVTALMEKENLENSPEGRAAAIGILSTRIK